MFWIMAKRDVETNTHHSFGMLKGVTDLQAVNPEHLYIVVNGEDRLAKESLKRQLGDSKTEDAVNAFINAELRGISETHVGKWPFMPVRLGRMAGCPPTMLDDPAPLPAQLTKLRHKKHGKQHFRFAVINGFGANFGDNTVGIGAFKLVARCLGEHFPSFSVDVLFGPETAPANADILAHEPSIERVLFRGPALIDFALYDGYFDVSGLITLPKNDSMPTVDWYLWWFGLNPDAIPAMEKRNRACVRWDAWNAVRDILKPITGTTIFFNPKASVPLRSLPPKTAARLVRRVLELEKHVRLIIDRPLDVKHPRIVDLSDKIDSPEKFKALIAQVDGLITVDSFAPQFADAASTPCVHLCASIPGSFYPAYPYSAMIDIDNIKALPAYRKFKVSDEEWLEIKDVYEASWQKLDPKHVVAVLKEKMALRKGTPQEPVGLSLVAETPRSTCTRNEPSGVGLKRQVLSPELLRIQTRLPFLTKLVLRPGKTCLIAGVPSCPAAADMAAQVQPGGICRIFEPRTLPAQLLGCALVHSHILSASISPHIPIAHTGEISFPDLDPWTESQACAWGNSLRTVSASTRPIDELHLKHCHAIIVQPPMPVLNVVSGAMETLKQCRPVVFVAPVSKNEAESLCRTVHSADYTVWAEPVLPEHGMEIMLLLCVPSEIETRLDGFVKIEVRK